jgi:hypothetical protein
MALVEDGEASRHKLCGEFAGSSVHSRGCAGGRLEAALAKERLQVLSGFATYYSKPL